MKLRWIILFAAGIAVITVAVGFGMAVLVDDRAPWVFLATALCTLVLIIAPAIASLIISNVTFDLTSADGRRALRRFILVIAGIQAIGATGSVLVAVAAPELTLLLVGVVAASVLMAIVGLWLGIRLQRRIGREPTADVPWLPWSPSVVRAKTRRVVVVFLLASLLGTGGIIGLELAFSESEQASSPIAWVLFGLSLGFISASLTCLVVAWPLVRNLRQVLGRDYSSQRAIGRVVLRGKDDPLSDDDRRRAASYAAIMSAYIPFQLAQSLLLLTGIWLQQVWSLVIGLAPNLATITIGIAVAIPVLLAVLVPLTVRQLRRAQHFAKDHAHLSDQAR